MIYYALICHTIREYVIPHRNILKNMLSKQRFWCDLGIMISLLGNVNAYFRWREHPHAFSTLVFPTCPVVKNVKIWFQQNHLFVEKMSFSIFSMPHSHRLMAVFYIQTNATVLTNPKMRIRIPSKNTSSWKGWGVAITSPCKNGSRGIDHITLQGLQHSVWLQAPGNLESTHFPSVSEQYVTERTGLTRWITTTG